jgi:hypothetical protein
MADRQPHPGSRLVAVLLASAVLLVAVPAMAEVEVAVARHRDALEVSFTLLSPMPEALEAALPSGAQVRIVYSLRVKAKRRLIWNRRVWKGEITASVAFDPVTGRYQCELVLDEVIVASQETRSASAARQWLTAPPAVRLSIPSSRRTPELLVRVRAIFSSSTRWLLFPSIDGTEWSEQRVEPGQ